MKEYALLAVWKRDMESEAFEVTRMCRGPAADLRVEIPLLPPNTLRICVVDNKEFERLSKLDRERVDAMLLGNRTPLEPLSFAHTSETRPEPSPEQGAVPEAVRHQDEQERASER